MTASAPDRAGARVLYIDDDPGLSRLVEKDLRRHGFSVRLASNGEEGLALARAEPFDVIALDHFMPEHDGLVTLADLRTLPSPPPIVYVTGSDEGRIAVAALKSGAVDYVIKHGQESFFELLRNTLKQAVAGAMLRREKDEAEQAVREGRDRAEALAERLALMLREVNHRVANSLQLISSLVTLQLGALRDPTAADALRETQNRISAIMQVHRRLYTSEDVQSVELSEYLSGLIEELRMSLSGGDDHSIELQAEAIRIPTDKAVSVGVIVTELVTNAVKYAYPAGTRGPIRIDLQRGPDAVLTLTVTDNGVGYPPDGAAAKGTGIGRRITEAMAANLQTKVEVDPSHSGTRVVLQFTPLPH